jgi:hypothetical protein
MRIELQLGLRRKWQNFFIPDSSIQRLSSPNARKQSSSHNIAENVIRFSKHSYLNMEYSDLNENSWKTQLEIW